MSNKDCVHNLMKAISCYERKDERVWYYLFEVARGYTGVSEFLKKYDCDLVNALLGYEHVLQPYDWIAQMLCWFKFRPTGSVLFGTAIYGKEVDLNLRYSFEEYKDEDLSVLGETTR